MNIEFTKDDIIKATELIQGLFVEADSYGEECLHAVWNFLTIFRNIDSNDGLGASAPTDIKKHTCSLIRQLFLSKNNAYTLGLSGAENFDNPFDFEEDDGLKRLTTRFDNPDTEALSIQNNHYLEHLDSVRNMLRQCFSPADPLNHSRCCEGDYVTPKEDICIQAYDFHNDTNYEIMHIVEGQGVVLDVNDTDGTGIFVPDNLLESFVLDED